MARKRDDSCFETLNETPRNGRRRSQVFDSFGDFESADDDNYWRRTPCRTSSLSTLHRDRRSTRIEWKLEQSDSYRLDRGHRTRTRQSISTLPDDVAMVEGEGRVTDDFVLFREGNLPSRTRASSQYQRQQQRCEQRYPDRRNEISGEYNRRTRANSSLPVSGRRTTMLQLPSYDGRSCLRTFLVKFRNYCDFYDLSDKAARSHLTQSLTDVAAQVLWSISPDASVGQLINKLKIRFGQGESKGHWRQTLRNRRQARNETLENLYLDIIRVSDLAYIGCRNDLVQERDN
jgi:hypothetical protein